MSRIRTAIIPAILAAVVAAGCNKSGDNAESAVPAPVTITTNAPLQTDGRWFKDSQGRVVILRGINVSNSVKRAPFDYNISEADWDNMQAWGINVVRLLIIWEAIEPMPGVYMDTLFQKTAEQIQWAADRGIYVILDMHQDVFGPAFGGDGAPEWAAIGQDTFQHNEPWGINYFAPEVMESYDNFWGSADLQAHFTGAWLKAVQRFIDRPNVIGYDLYNEPYFGSRAPWEFERFYLGPFENNVAGAIRALDPDRIVFYEPMIFTSGGIASFLPPPSIKGNVALAPHYYDPTLGFVHTDPYDGNRSRAKAMMDLRDRECIGLGNIPWLLGEFGIAQGTNSDLYVQHLYEELDAHMASATYWVYSKDNYMGPLYPDGSDKPRLDDMVRPLPTAVAGIPLQFSFDKDTKIFTLTIREDDSAQGPTEIFIPEARHYPNGFTVESTGNGWSYEYDGRTLKWYSDHTRFSNTLTIKPKP